MKQGNITIDGVIGSYTNPEGKEVKGVELIDVIAQVKAQPDVDVFKVLIKSPGGLVDTGNQIYDYLVALKAQGKKIITATIGNIGSIATKIYLAGDEREIREGDEFFIHNPWTSVTGDSVEMKAELASLEVTEKALRGFYQQATGINETGLAALMDNETGMNADKAVTLGFATKKVGKAQKTFALLKTPTMSTQAKNDGASIIASAEKAIKEILSGVQKALGVPTQKAEGALALDLEGAGGTKISVTSEDPNNLVGSDVMITDASGSSAPAPDGEVPLADGRVLVVAGGKVTEVKPAAAPAAAATPDLAAQLKAAQDEIAALKAAQTAAPAAAAQTVDVKAEIEKALTDFKNTLVPPKAVQKGFNDNGDGKTVTHLSIDQRMLEKQAARKEARRKN